MAWTSRIVYFKACKNVLAVPWPRWPQVWYSWTALYLLNLLILSFELSLKHLLSRWETLDSAALSCPPGRNFKGYLKHLSTFFTRHGDIVALRLAEVCEDSSYRRLIRNQRPAQSELFDLRHFRVMKDRRTIQEDSQTYLLLKSSEYVGYSMQICVCASFSCITERTLFHLSFIKVGVI